MSDDVVVLNQIISGVVRCNILGEIFFIYPPSPRDKFQASILFNDSIVESSLLEILSQQEMILEMIKDGEWSEEEENEFHTIVGKMDALKVDMYSKYISHQGNKIKQSRNLLKRAKIRYRELSEKRHSRDLYTSEGLAQSLYTNYLISKNTTDENSKIVEAFSFPSWKFDTLVNEYLLQIPSEITIRQLSKNPKWKSMWANGKQNNGVFNTSSSNLTDQQQSLIAWSKLYDSIFEHMEAPAKEVIEDDDLLDGWIILQQKKQDEKTSQSLGSNIAKNAQEVFIVAETKEDAQRINNMNSSNDKFIKEQRMLAIKKHGVVKEEHLPDSQQEMVMQAINQKGRK